MLKQRQQHNRYYSPAGERQNFLVSLCHYPSSRSAIPRWSMRTHRRRKRNRQSLTRLPATGNASPRFAMSVQLVRTISVINKTECTQDITHDGKPFDFWVSHSSHGADRATGGDPHSGTIVKVGG